MITRKIQLMLSISILILAGFACAIDVGGPETPSAPSAVSTELATSLVDAWQQAFETAEETGAVTLSLTEGQLTSFMSTKLEMQEDPFFSEPQVFLRDQQFQIFGKVKSGNLTATVRVILSVQVNQEGIPTFSITSADFGPVPVPNGLLDSLSGILDEAFTGKVGPLATGLRIDAIHIDEGFLIILGRVR